MATTQLADHVRYTHRGYGDDRGLYRLVLQPDPTPFRAGFQKPDPIRNDGVGCGTVTLKKAVFCRVRRSENVKTMSGGDAMAKERKSMTSGGEVLEKAAETAKVEQYWILADKSEPRVPPKDFKYVEELAHLQIELIKMQEWVKYNRLRVCVIFEGRDAAGKGGVIKRITDPLNPRICRVVALSTPTEKERGQWYFQRYVAELPSLGEIVLFDRSWYNRAGVEHVMDFCTDEEYREFLRACPLFEEMLIKSGIILAKYWFSVNDEEQEARFQERMRNPIKRWKLSGMDVESRRHWVDYSRAKDAMFAETDTKISPWYVVNSDDKKKSRLNCIAHLLSKVPYKDLKPVAIELPPRQSDDYKRPEKSSQRFVPEIY
jgi:polyphosphate kinase